MSHIGKLSRGAKWYRQRTLDGLPEGVASDPAKMDEVNYFLDHCKTRDINKIIVALDYIQRLNRSLAKNKQQFIDEQVAFIDAPGVKK